MNVDFKTHKPHDSRSFPWFAALVILNLIDVMFTREIISQGGVELNPVFEWLFPNLEMIQSIIIIKVAALALCQTMWKHMKLWQKISVDIVYVGVVLYSLTIIT